jgi:hypothetical protein
LSWVTFSKSDNFLKTSFKNSAQKVFSRVFFCFKFLSFSQLCGDHEQTGWRVARHLLAIKYCNFFVQLKIATETWHHCLEGEHFTITASSFVQFSQISDFGAEFIPRIILLPVWKGSSGGSWNLKKKDLKAF